MYDFRGRKKKTQVKMFYMNNFCAKTIYMKIPKIAYSSEIKQKQNIVPIFLFVKL